jgi:hypothetical protein
MPRGSSPKREREYEEIKDKLQRSGRYGKRAKEVAARIVNKQRAEHGETRSAKNKTTSRKTAHKSSAAKHRTKSRSRKSAR